MADNIQLPDFDIFELSPLGHAYHMLLAEGWSQRQALYIAWASHPKELRTAAGLPEKQIDFARQILLLKDDSTIRQWRRKYDGRDEKHPDIQEAIQSIQKRGPLSYYRARVLHALGESAANNTGRDGHPDRKLFLEMTGDYVPRTRQEVTGKDGGPIAVSRAEELTDDELAAIAAGRQPGRGG